MSRYKPHTEEWSPPIDWWPEMAQGKLHGALSEMREAMGILSTGVQGIALYTLEKSQGLNGEDGKAVESVKNMFLSQEFYKDPIEVMRLGKEELAKYPESSATNSLRAFTDHVGGMYDMLCTSAALSPAAQGRAWKKCAENAKTIAETAKEVRLGKEEFQVLFDDPKFSEVKVAWNESRDAWGKRERRSDYYEAHSQIETISKPLEQFEQQLTEYSKTVAFDPEKTDAITKMQARIMGEKISLTTEGVIINIQHQADEARRVEWDKAVAAAAEKAAMAAKVVAEAKAAAANADIVESKVAAANADIVASTISAAKAVGSVLKNMGEKKDQGKEKTHVKRLAEPRGKSAAVDKGGRG